MRIYIHHRGLVGEVSDSDGLAILKIRERIFEHSFLKEIIDKFDRLI